MAKASGMFPEGKAGRAGPGGMPRQERWLGGGEEPKKRWRLGSPFQKKKIKQQKGHYPLHPRQATVFWQQRTFAPVAPAGHTPTNPWPYQLPRCRCETYSCLWGGVGPRQRNSGPGNPGASLSPPLAPNPKSSPLPAGPPLAGGRGRQRAASDLALLRTGRSTWPSHLPEQKRLGELGRGPNEKRELCLQGVSGPKTALLRRGPGSHSERSRGGVAPKSRAPGTSRRRGSRTARRGQGRGGASGGAPGEAWPPAPGPSAEGRGSGLLGDSLFDGPVARRRGLGELEELPSGFLQ